MPYVKNLITISGFKIRAGTSLTSEEINIIIRHNVDFFLFEKKKS